jgi:hypothetical protein
MVGCYTNATNPRVRGVFYRLAKPANGENIWREKNSGNIWWEKVAGTYGGKKLREQMVRKNSEKIAREN